MSLPADGVNANALAETTTIPTGKKLIFLDPDTNEGGIITLENLTKQILSNLATQTFNLDQGTKTLLAALNELNSKGSQIVATGINDLDNPPNAIILRTTTNPVGLPGGLGSNGCIAVQQNPNNAFNCQLAFSFGSDKIAIRRKRNNTAWTDWKYFSAE